VRRGNERGGGDLIFALRRAVRTADRPRGHHDAA
jgi:hypothetical protein